MKIEVKYPIEQYKNKFPFEVPKKIYRVSVAWRDEKYWESYLPFVISGFVVASDENEEMYLCPVVYEKPDYLALDDFPSDEYYDTLEEAKENFARLYKDYWGEDYKVENK